MANPNSPTNGQGQAVDLVVDAAGYAGLKRGFGREDITGADTDGLYQGVMALPAAVGAVDTAVAAALQAALPAVASKTNYLMGFSISGQGATGAAAIEATISGLIIGTMSIWVQIPAGVTTAITPILVTLPNPIPASAPNTAITLDVPSFGTGNTDAECAIWGAVSA